MTQPLRMHPDIARIQVENIISKIIDGCYDDHLQSLRGALINRITLNAAKFAGLVTNKGININSVQVGDEVVFNDLVRPQYLCGSKATIVKVNRQRVKIKLVTPVGRFKGIVNTSPTVLNLVG